MVNTSRVDQNLGENLAPGKGAGKENGAKEGSKDRPPKWPRTFGERILERFALRILTKNGQFVGVILENGIFPKLENLEIYWKNQ